MQYETPQLCLLLCFAQGVVVADDQVVVVVVVVVVMLVVVVCERGCGILGMYLCACGKMGRG